MTVNGQDTEFPCIFPQLNEEANSNVLYQSIELDATASQLVQRCCDLYQSKPTLVLATIWAATLHKFTKAERVKFALFQEEPVHGVACVQGRLEDVRAKSYAAHVDRDTPASELMKGNHWEVLPHVPGDRLLNTGLYMARAAVPEFATILKGLDICIVCGPESPRLTLIFKSRLLCPTFARSVASAIPQGMHHILNYPATSIGDINLFSQTQEDLVRSWQGSESLQSRYSFLFEYLSRQAIEQADTVAIDAWDGRWTYQELDEISTNLASHLQAHGVRNGTLVTVCFEKTRWAVVATLAVNKAGGGFVPCDPTYPAEKREKIIHQARSPLILTSSKSADHFAGWENPAVMIISPATLSNIPKAPYRVPVDSDAPAYVLFTSGSTGEPKGCEISHAAFASTSNHIKALHLECGIRALQFASFSFGMSIIEVFCTLITGGTVCMLSDEQRLNSLAGTMTAMKINWALMTPTVLGSLQPRDLPHLKTLLVGGEALNEAQIQMWSPVVEIYQVYGLTEWTGIFAVSDRITRIEQRQTIGSPANAQAWLVDPNQPNQLVPVGAAGELVIRGPGLATGYYQAAEMTAAAFFSSQWLRNWTSHDGDRVYRTGDIMRYNACGSLSYVGRRDNQGKIRGMRVELSEVEYNLMQLVPDAKRVVAMFYKPQERDEQQQVLLALIHMPPSVESKSTDFNSLDSRRLFLEPTEDRRRALDDALKRLTSRLPEYMIPQYLLALTAFPTTVSGKVDRRKLTSLMNQLTASDLQILAGRQTEYQAPITESERQVHDLACAILGVKSVSMNDNFFDLRGDSVLAMKMAGLARRRNMQLMVADVFRNPILKDLALACRPLNEALALHTAAFRLLNPTDTSRIVHEAAQHMEESRVVDIYPCTPLQEGIWALSVRNPTLYKARMICKLRPHVDCNSFKRAWERVFELNDILRTRLFPSSSGMLQAVLREPFEWDAAEELQPYLDMTEQEHIGVGRRLVRACLLTEKTQPTFILTIHHALCDRWSLRLLLEQIEKHLSSTPPSTHHPFSPFIEHLVDMVPRSQKYWVDQFQGLETSPFPVLPSPGYTPRARQISRSSFRLPRRVLRDKTLASHLRLAWSLVLSHNTCSDDIVFGTTVTGRGSNVRGIEALSGPTIATVPFRTRLNPTETVAGALSAVQELTISMMPFEQAGLQNIQKYSPEAESACMFQNTLTIQPAWSDSLTQFEVCQEGAASAGGFASYALCLECYPDTDETQLEIHVAYDSNIIPSTRIRRFLMHFEFTINEIMTCPQKALCEVQRISPADLVQLGIWNATLPSQPQEAIHSIVQAQAKKTPLALAVSSLEGELTYEELDRLSMQLAGELLHRGAKAGMLIPLLFEKSRWAIVAMLAVLKAGCGIVALDPSYPVDRMRAICGQVESPLGICSKRYVGTMEQIGPEPIIASESLSAWDQSVECLDLPVIGVDSTMYLIFTSGSTGLPKGVMVNHDCFASSTLAYRAEIKLDSNSRVLQFCSFAFDFCFAEIFGTLMAGACVCVPSDADRMNEIYQAMRKLLVTHAFFTPSYACLVQPKEVPSLRVVMLGGEPLKGSDVEHWAPHVHLVNGYGPSECAPISSTQHLDGSADILPQDIGYCRGCVGWICDPRDHDILLPIGAIGELIIEGPNVGPGYLQNSSETARAFVEPPQWLKGFRVHTTKRVYKTKDLVQYTEDGRLRYVGRIGQQVKLRGQRLEPSHVEHYLLSWFEGAVEVAAIVATPKDANDRATLIGFVLIAVSDSPLASSDEVICLPPSEQFCLLVATARSKLQQFLPEFMVPSIIISVSSMPRTTSGKLDRQRLTQEITSRTWDQLMQFEALNVPSPAVSSDLEFELQRIWSRVLNIPVSAIGTNKSFFQLGGDSITAMLVASQARDGHMRLQLTMEDIFRLRTISKIATHATAADSSNLMLRANQDTVDQYFTLTPIQQLFFDTNQSQKQDRFSQNLLLHLRQLVTFDQLRSIILELVKEHPTLRSRFLRNANAQWQQLISSEIRGSFACRYHQLASEELVKGVLLESRQALDISTGPVFSVDLIEVNGNQALFLLAHHLVIDMVSWTVLLTDLKSLLHGQPISKGQSTSFQTWCKLLNAYSQETPPAPQELPQSDTLKSFWGVADRLNTIGQSREMVVHIDIATTEVLLGEANKVFGTQPVELLHAALLFAFTMTFPNRPAPVIFSEEHGREPWKLAIDLTRTVGCFTTIAPIHVEVDATGDIFAIVRQVKDARRSLRSHGLKAFMARCSNTGKQRTGLTGKMEIVFNHDGRYHQQLGQTGSLFAVESLQNMSILDAADDARRWSLIDINTFVQDGQLVFKFTFPQGDHFSRVLQQWTACLRKTVGSIATDFKNHPRTYTLADFPLLNLDYSRLDHLMEILQRAGLQPQDVEDIYPCSAVQRGILLSQAKDPSAYHVVTTWQIVSRADKPASAERAKSAIEQVMARHACLRTRFIETTSETAAFDQVVLRKPLHQVVIYSSLEKGTQALLQGDPFQPSPSSPLRFSIHVASDQNVYIRLDISHALTDAKSLALLEREICLAYASQLSSQERPLFSNYIRFLQTRDPTADAEFWDTYLDGIQPCQFPALIGQDNTRRRVMKEYVFDVTGVDGIKAYCKDRNITAPNVFCVAWSMVLSCFSGSDDVCFGNLNSGRELPFDGALEVIGPLINMLPVRVNLRDATLEGLLQHVHADYAAGLAHQTYPVADIFHRKELGGLSLFNTGISVDRVAGSRNAPSSMDLHLIERIDHAEYDIVLNVQIERSRTVVYLRYWTSCLSESQAPLVAACFDQAVSRIIDDDQAPASRVDLFSQLHRDLIWRWNKVLPTFHDSLVHDIVQQRATENPDAPAVCSSGGTLTYAELDALSSALSGYLSHHGVGTEVFVPLCFEKCMWAVVSLLAVVKAGGAFVLLDAGHPDERLETICRDVGSSLLLSSPAQAERCARITSTVVVVVVGGAQDVWRNTTREPSNLLLSSSRNIRPNNAVYAVYTSGATGKPKGIIIEHRSFCSMIHAQTALLDITPSARVLQFSSYAFDVSIFEMLMPLMTGGCVCVLSEMERRDCFVEVVGSLRVSHALLTPSYSRLVSPDELPELRVLVCGGEAMTQHDMSRWLNHVALINHYGPAECSVCSVVQPNINPTSEIGEIGRGAGCATWIVDPDDHERLVPVGAVGELVIEGPIVGRGYLNLPTATQAAFIEPPQWLRNMRSSLGPNNRLYKTGDLVRYGSDGKLYIHGRKDTQIKIRGQRLELQELEYHVHRYFGSAGNVVVELIRIDSNPSLVAFIGATKEMSTRFDRFGTADKDFRNSAAATSTQLFESLPSYMVPTYFIPSETLPLNASGKVDRKLLQSLVEALSPDQLKAYRPSTAGQCKPSSSEEKLLHAIWVDVLGVEPESIGADDHFFQVGGDSVNAMRVAASARKQGLNIVVADIFAHPRLAALANAGARRNIEQFTPTPFSLCPVKDLQLFSMLLRVRRTIPSDSHILDILPASAAQSFFLTRLTLHHFTFDIEGALEVGRLRDACDQVFGTFSILRTVFVPYEHQILQVILDQVDTPFYHFVVNEPVPDVRTRLLTADREHIPLIGRLAFAFLLISHVDEPRHSLSFRVSHAQWDGLSIGELFSALQAAYHERPITTTTPLSTYLYYRALRDKSQSLRFWQDHLQGSAITRITEVPRELMDLRHGDTIWENTNLRPAPEPPLGITMASVVKSAWGLVLAQERGARDIVFGQTVNSRSSSLPDIDRILGCCLNFIPARIQLQPSWTGQDLLQHVQTQYHQTLQHDDLELPEIIDQCTDWPSGMDLNTVVQHQNIPLHHQMPLGDLQPTFSLNGYFRPGLELFIFTEPCGDVLSVQLCVNPNMMGLPRAQALHQRLVTLIVGLCRSPDTPISCFLDSV